MSPYTILTTKERGDRDDFTHLIDLRVPGETKSRIFVHQKRTPSIHQSQHRYSEWANVGSALEFWNLGVITFPLPEGGKGLKGCIRSVEWSKNEPWFISGKPEPESEQPENQPAE